MKKIIILAFVASLCACNQDHDQDQNGTPQSQLQFDSATTKFMEGTFQNVTLVTRLKEETLEQGAVMVSEKCLGCVPQVLDAYKSIPLEDLQAHITASFKEHRLSEAKANLFLVKKDNGPLTVIVVKRFTEKGKTSWQTEFIPHDSLQEIKLESGMKLFTI